MKKTFLLVILFGLINLSSLAQSYKPMLDSWNEWHFTQCFSGCYSDKYFTDGDTLVNGKSYKILDGYHYISRSFLLRENLSDKKVHLLKIEPGKHFEYLLYDFNLQVGDSILMQNPISPFMLNAGFYNLDSIKLKPLIDGNLYKHFYFSPTLTNNISVNNSIWVEGVGSLSIVNAPSGYPDINGVGKVSCFFKNGNLFYSDLDSIVECIPDISLSIDENLVELDDSFYPNPSTSQITFSQENIEGIELNILNTNGEFVSSIILPSGEQTTSLNLIPGFYLMEIQMKNKEKVIKKLVIFEK
jgi:hypothetical protein